MFCSGTRGKLCRPFTHELNTKKREGKHRNINASKTHYKQDTEKLVFHSGFPVNIAKFLRTSANGCFWKIFFFAF